MNEDFFKWIVSSDEYGFYLNPIDRLNGYISLRSNRTGLAQYVYTKRKNFVYTEPGLYFLNYDKGRGWSKLEPDFEKAFLLAYEILGEG